MTNTSSTDKAAINPKLKMRPNTFQWGVCTNHGSWYTGEVECPKCFKQAQLPWYRRIFT